MRVGVRKRKEGIYTENTEIAEGTEKIGASVVILECSIEEIL